MAGCCPARGSLGETLELSGLIEAWTGGAGVVMVQASRDGAALTTLATGQVEASGRFVISMPGAAELDPFLKEFDPDAGSPSTGMTSCTGKPTSSPPGLRVTPAILQVASASGRESSLTYTTAASPLSAPFFTYVFADRNGSIDGNRSCKSTVTGVQTETYGTYEICLARGWNLIKGEIVNRTSTSTSFALTADAPEGGRWYPR